MATANLHHSAPANLDHPLYPIYFIRSCTLPRPVTPGDAISAATLSVPPQHNLLFVTRVQGIKWCGGLQPWTYKMIGICKSG